MKTSVSIFFFGLVIFAASCTQPAYNNSAEQDITVAFYNVENLFDTIDAPNVSDEEWLPDSEKQWNTEKYTKKLEDLSKVLSSLADSSLPDIIGLCEVENKQVVEDLVNTTNLKPGNYKIVHEDSPDERGIDVALIYKENGFSYLSHEKLTVVFNDTINDKTRDILYVKGIAAGDTLHLFVNHWPSRSGGEAESEPKRISAATVLRGKVDNILAKNNKAKVLIMGDFNDFPDNNSITNTLGANAKGSSLYNLSYPLFAQGKGTYNYRGNWNMLDQFIVSDGLMNATHGFDADTSGFIIFAPEWVLYKTKEGTYTPSRTFGGPNYYGGISDHLAISTKLTYLK